MASDLLNGFRAGLEAGRPIVEAQMQKLLHKRQSALAEQNRIYSSSEAQKTREHQASLAAKNIEAGKDTLTTKLGHEATQKELDRAQKELDRAQAGTLATQRIKAEAKLHGIDAGLRARGLADSEKRTDLIGKQYEDDSKSVLVRNREALTGEILQQTKNKKALATVLRKLEQGGFSEAAHDRLLDERDALEAAVTASATSLDMLAATVGKAVTEGSPEDVVKASSLLTDKTEPTRYQAFTVPNELGGADIFKFDPNAGSITPFGYELSPGTPGVPTLPPATPTTPATPFGNLGDGGVLNIDPTSNQNIKDFMFGNGVK